MRPVSSLRPIPLRKRLLTMALASILPLALIAGLALVQYTLHQTEQAKQRSLEVTRMAATAIELELSRSINVLQALAQSTLLDAGDLTGFGDLARRIMPVVPGWHAVLVATPTGEVIARISNNSAVNTRALAERDSFDRLLQTHLPVIGQLKLGPSGKWAVPLRVPVLRDGHLRYVLTAVLRPEALVDVITMRSLPPGWVTTVIDANGVRIARSLHHAETLGGPASPSLAQVLAENSAPEGTAVTRTLEGEPVHTAFVRLPEAGWTVATGIPTAQVRASARRAFLTYGGGLALSLLLAMAAALIAARRINRPMRQLSRAARAFGQHEPMDVPSSEIREIQQVGQALLDAAEARRVSEAEREAVMANLRCTKVALREQLADLQLLHDLSQGLLQLPSLEAQLDAILSTLCDFYGATHGIVALSLHGGPLQPFALRGFARDPYAEMAPLATQQGTTARAMREGERVIVTDVETDPDFAPFRALARREGFRAVHSTPLRSVSGQVIGSISVQLGEARGPTERELRMTDLCAGLAALYVERSQAHEAAGRSEQRLQVALESSTMPFGILQPVRSDGRITDFRIDYLNRVGAQAMRRPLDVLLGQPIARIVPGWQRERVFTACATVVEQQTTVELEWQANPDANGPWFQIVANPFQQGVALWFANISQRKADEQALREADRRKDAFLATLAHELRNPLAPIRQAAALVGSADATPEQKQWGEAVIERQVNHMALLLEDLLDVSRITLGKIALRRQRVPLADIIDGALQTTRGLLEAKRHQLHYRAPPRALQLDADPLRVEQIITNLLTNAAKYTPEGGEIRIEVAFERHQAIITVADNGMGIDPAQQEQVFQMFVQLPTPDQRPTSGLGIGLPLARGLAQLHGGELSVQSDGPGRGSRFILHLPLARPDAAQAIEAEPNVASVKRPRRRILVADDNHDIADTMAELLRMEGHEVATAFDGDEALQQYLAFRPEVALLDIGMPKRRGDEVARAIRALPQGQDVLLVAFTGWGQALDREQTLAAGFDRHLTKPASLQDIFAILDEAGSAAR